MGKDLNGMKCIKSDVDKVLVRDWDIKYDGVIILTNYLMVIVKVLVVILLFPCKTLIVILCVRIREIEVKEGSKKMKMNKPVGLNGDEFYIQ